jgi:hypothetical protein
MKNICIPVLMIAMVFACFPSCSSEDPFTDPTQSSDSGSGSDGSGSSGGDTSYDSGDESTTNDALESFTIDLNTTALSETETIPTDEKAASYEDYVEHSYFDSTVSVVYSGTSATVTNNVTGVAVTTDGGDVTVKSTVGGVKYALSGTTTNGSFKIYSDKKYEIDLNGVSITNADGAAINSQSKKRAFIVLGSGSTNTLVDGSSYTAVTGEDMKGTIFSEGQIIFSGAGTLNVTANAKNGIVSDDYVTFRPGNVINITAKGSNGVKANDAINVNGGVLNITTSATASKGLSSDGAVNINGGRTTVITSGGAEYDSEEKDATACAGVKADSTFTMNDGWLYIKSSGQGGKGISTDQAAYINGGVIEIITTGKKYSYSNSITTSPKGIKADGNLTFAGGTTLVRTTGGEGSEGIEGKNIITVNGGTIKVYAYDDAFNASKQIVFNNGYLYTYSTNNDGLDSNGTMSFNGGVAICNGTSAPEDGFDCDQNTFTVTGGVLIGTGGGTSTPTTSSCTQPVILYGGSVTAGKYLTVADASGNNIITYSVPRTSATVLLSSPSLKKGSTYTVSLGATVSGGTEFCGYVTGATVSGGSSLGSATLSSMVTTIGTISGGGGPGGGGFPGGPGR